MTDSKLKYEHELDVKSASKNLRPLLIRYIANLMKLEDLAKVIPDESNNAKVDKSISDIMEEQKDILQELYMFETQDAQDAKRILNIWLSEELDPVDVSHAKQLVLNVYNYIDEHAN